MAEKLYKRHCRVTGHGNKCEVAQDKKKGKRELSKFRRRLYKKKVDAIFCPMRARGSIMRGRKENKPHAKTLVWCKW